MAKRKSDTRTCAIYLRISLDRKMDGLAIERQCEDCERRARERGWDIHIPEPSKPSPYCHYVDQSKSATDKTKRRPAYDRLVADYKAGRFDAIVCWDLDRLTRQPRQLEDWIDEAEDHGLVLLTVSESVDLSTENGRMFARVKAAVARAEVERMGQRRHRALVQHAALGKIPTGPRLYGYNWDGSVNEYEAEIVRTIYRRFLGGVAVKTMCRTLMGKPVGLPVKGLPCTPRPSYAVAVERNERLAAEGKPTKPLPPEQPWTNTMVTSMLRNPRYAGYSFKMTDADRRDRKNNAHTSKVPFIVKGDDGQPVMGEWEPLVSEADWLAVQDILDDPARKTNRKGCRRAHLGSGLFLCGTCGRPMAAHGGDKRHYNTYYCNRQDCPRPVYRRKEHVDAYVLAYVRAFLGRPDMRDLLVVRDDARLDAVNDEIKRQRMLISRAEDGYLEGALSAAKARSAREKAEAEIERLEAERAALVADGSPDGILSAADPVAAFDAATLDEQRAVINALCTVVVHVHDRADKDMVNIDVDIIPKTRLDGTDA
ncbi:DNA-invertase hin [Slackia heliotrinireducens]|uniref:Site-specific recombinase, DNA invertase Pin n=1 Tax=Slackia heliotrinireducens (strain ATCC 29202 / DSM 20476 / NCTC 11029 / RHS 1) TaxID=471855 RepID=C7N813_SLAHD|nr:recombinase family protein [Slackia heliotrinireducens]ACV23048.1 site-specific recombinase, DNA invertase Pin [Slackia heliotrinireducens DSM 20476]VEH01987.1 DNA-invertase hin [Slackia heliotrinireducens]